MKRKKNYLLILFGVIYFSFSSCNDVDLDNFSKEISLKESLVTPIGESTVSLGQLLNLYGNKSKFGYDADSIFYQLTDSGDIDFPVFDLNLYIQPLQSSIKPFPTNTTITPSSVIAPVEINDIINLGINTDVAEQRVDSVWITTAKFVFTLNSSAFPAGNHNFTVTFPGDKLKFKNGNTVQLVRSFSNFNQPIEVDLSDIVLISNGVSSLPVKIVIDITPSTSNINVGPSTSINMTTEINEIVYDVAFGFFKPQLITNQSKKFSFDVNKQLRKEFPSNTDYILKSINPRIDIQIQSNVGTNLKFNVAEVRAFDTENPSVSVNAEFDNNQNSFQEMVNKPTIFRQTVTKNFRQLNKNNGKTHLLFDLTKNYNTLEYKWNIENSPEPNSANYILASTKLSAKVKLTIPMYFEKGSYLSTTDTIKNLNKEIASNFEDISLDSVMLVLRFKNGIPAKLKFEIKKFEDTQGNAIPLPGLNKVYLIASPDVNANGLSTNTVDSKIEIIVGRNQANELMKLENLIYNVTADGKTENSDVQLTKNNTLSVKAGIFLVGTINTNL